MDAPADSDSFQGALAAGAWRQQIGLRSLERGIEYAAQRRVLELQSSAGRLTAKVRGHHGNVYTAVAMAPDATRSAWSTTCTCPVGSGCKHVAAALIVASDEAGAAAAPPANGALARSAATTSAPPARDAAAEWERWIVELERSQTTRAAEAGADQVLGLLLRTERGRGASWSAAVVWLRPGKTRSLVDPQPVRLTARGPEPAPRGGWPAEHLLPLSSLLADAYHKHGSIYYTGMSKTHHVQALLALAERYPMYFERPSDGPLVQGPPLSLQLSWQQLENGSQRLRATVGGDENAVLLRGAGLWYVQRAERRFGRVDSPEHWLDVVARMPSLPPEQAAALRARLGSRSAIPPPAEAAPERRVRARPRALLRLRVVEISWRQNYQRRMLPAGCARLFFDYDEFRIPADLAGETRIMREGELIVVERDHRAEQHVGDLLDSVGLVDADLYTSEHGGRRPELEDGDFLLQPSERKPPFAPEAWKPVLKRLAEHGVRFEYEDGFPRDDLVEIDAWLADLAEAGNAWFDVSLGIEVAGERVDLLPILRRVLADPAFSLKPRKGERPNAALRVALDASRSAEVPLARLRALIEPLLEWLDSDAGGALRVHRSDAESLARVAETADLVWHGGQKLRTALGALAIRPHGGGEPPGFGTRLRNYQRDGLAWLDFLADAGLGGVLADDMGLGKTVQVLAHVLSEKTRGRLAEPALVVAPTSLVGNWRDEAARFAPDLRVLVLHGADRAERYDAIGAHDLVITTYPLLPRDRERLAAASFSLLILDEAQAIKNAKSQAARIVRELSAKRRLAMTGTPLENHLGELWAEFDAVEPGLLGSERQFARFYRTPIEKRGDAERQARLNRRIAPLMLRRRKEDVLTELPPKTEIVQRLELEGGQRELYETLRLAQHTRVREAVRERGLAQAGIVVLDALLKLRQVCCDPRLVKLESARRIEESVKLDALLERLGGLLDEGRRVLLFSQFAEMLKLISEALDGRGIAHLELTGSTPGGERAERVRAFQAGEAPVFLVSLKAGGVGLNLTAADTVIHYDPWWNPATEAQATDRAHRIGQDKPVFVYKLICAGTVEEKIQALQARKSELARAVLEGGSIRSLAFDEADLAELFAPIG